MSEIESEEIFDRVGYVQPMGHTSLDAYFEKNREAIDLLEIQQGLDKALNRNLYDPANRVQLDGADIEQQRQLIAGYVQSRAMIREFLRDWKTPTEFDAQFDFSAPWGRRIPDGLTGDMGVLHMDRPWLDLLQRMVFTGEIEQVDDGDSAEKYRTITASSK